MTQMPLAPSFCFDIEQVGDFVVVVLKQPSSGKQKTYKFAGKHLNGIQYHMLSLTDTQCTDLLKSEKAAK